MEIPELTEAMGVRSAIGAVARMIAPTLGQGVIMPTAVEGSFIMVLFIKHGPRHGPWAPFQVSDCTRGVRGFRTIATQTHDPRLGLIWMVQNGPHIGPLPNASGTVAILKAA